MKLTLDQINRLDAQQLTPQELLTLKLAINLDPPDIANLLMISRQRVHVILNSAHAKVDHQWRGELIASEAVGDE